MLLGISEAHLMLLWDVCAPGKLRVTSAPWDLGTCFDGFIHGVAHSPHKPGQDTSPSFLKSLNWWRVGEIIWVAVLFPTAFSAEMSCWGCCWHWLCIESNAWGASKGSYRQSMATRLGKRNKEKESAFALSITVSAVFKGNAALRMRTKKPW